MQQFAQTTHWNFGQKLAFRFISVFFALFIFPFPLNIIPGINEIVEPYNDLWSWMVSWVGSNILGIEQTITLVFTGSGDKLYDWVQNFIILCLTLIIGIVWTILDRKRPNYEKLKQWFVLFLTYYLVYFMFVYGIIKLFYLQFVPPNLERLMQTFGQASPMRLIWTFMGFSESYTMFSGFSETMAGVLLMFRRTRTLGGLVAFGVMLNVFMMNMSYDVPVKLFSAQLMLMGLYIACLDFKRLMNFFIFNKTVGPSIHKPLFKSKTGQIILLAIQVVLIGYIIINQVMVSMEGRERYGSEREKPAFYGVYNVETYISNSDTIPPLTTDSVRWEHMLVDYPAFTSIIKMDGRLQRYNSKIDTVNQKFVFTLPSDTVNQYELYYKLKDKDIRLSGILQGDTINVDLKYYPLENFALLNRGFNWVNEVPYNRYNYDH
ncbi:hypothetical protein QQ008_00550 [Fulvivirgaceae bacterium BMA10]|uniref:DoxX family protein n=1 Tax=Splendidivirga corallicola TaxID=3051826 RepID=A0ABT8KJ96_9BACT|nr:hypothetical protein [Fulvivirgaceae bacterium BMA10]